MTNENENTPLDEFLNRAVDRQVAEERALRQTLEELRSAVSELSALPVAAPQGDGTEGRAGGLARDSAQAVRAVEEELGSLRRAIGGVSADIEGIAQALIELNAGLRDWADGVDAKLSSVRETIEELRGSAGGYEGDDQAELDEDGFEIAEVEDPEQASDELPPPNLARREQAPAAPPEIDQRIKETVELSLYLADQIEDFDRVLASMGDLPTKLEGVVAQALRRTLTARAKLDREAETSMDDLLASLEEHLDEIAGTVERVTESEDQLRKMILGQVELGSRFESLQESLIERIEILDAERRRGEEILAKAIDRVAEGKSTKAYESLGKGKATKGGRAQGAKRKVSKSAKSAKSAKPRPAKKRSPAKRSSRRKNASTDDNAIAG